MTPISRYKALDEVMRSYRKGKFDFRIEGTDELIARESSVMFESCNTSFQIHIQVDPDDFTDKYNWHNLYPGHCLPYQPIRLCFSGKGCGRKHALLCFSNLLT